MTAVVDTFVRTVWTQMAAVFPYEYLHMGGDEVGGTGYGAFVRRTEAIINSLGRKMIGWDAIYDSVANPTTMTQTWKPNNDHPNSIYSWQNYLYFDYDPVALPISEVYRPCVGVTNHYGIESALWTEHISPANGFADRNMWPRQAAAAEAAWSAYEDWATSGNTLPNFYVRMQPFGCRFTCLGMSTWNQDTVIHWQGCPAESSTVATNALSNYDWKLIPVSAPTGTMAMHSRMPASPNLNMLAKAGYKSVDIRGRVVSVRDLGASNGPGNARGIHFVVDTKGCLAQKVVVK
jgi:hypothetical protein